MLIKTLPLSRFAMAASAIKTPRLPSFTLTDTSEDKFVQVLIFCARRAKVTRHLSGDPMHKLKYQMISNNFVVCLRPLQPERFSCLLLIYIVCSPVYISNSPRFTAIVRKLYFALHVFDCNDGNTVSHYLIFAVRQRDKLWKYSWSSVLWSQVVVVEFEKREGCLQ